MPIDPALFYTGIAAFLAIGAGVGYFVNNGKARAALTFARSTIAVLQSCNTAGSDGTITPDEERQVGRAALHAYRDGGVTLKALMTE
jgi:hypothetical protein